jgi:integrase
MASFRRLASGSWCAQVFKQGVRTSQTFPTKAHAVAWATGVEAEILARRRGQILRRSLKQALERYRDEESSKKRGAKFERSRLNAMLDYGIEFGDKWLENVTADDFQAWAAHRLQGVKASSVNRDLNLLCAVFTACVSWGWLHSSPLKNFRRPKNPPPRSRLITWQEVVKVLRALGWRRAPPETLQQQVGFAFLMSLHTAMRAGEVLSYELRGTVAHLEMTKNGDARDVPLSTRALRLHALCPRYTVTSASLDALFRKARQSAGLEGFVFHDARASALTRLSRKLDVLELAKVSGHRDLNQLLKAYYRTTAADIGARLR